MTGVSVSASEFRRSWMLVGVLCPEIVTTNPGDTCAPNTIDITNRALYAGSKDTLAGTWNYWTDAGATSPIADPTAVSSSGTYYITNTGIGCTDTAQIDVTVNATPDLSITQPPAVCSPNTIDLTAIVGGTGLGTNSYYTNANGTGSVTDETSVGDGTYYVVTVDGNNCSDTAQIDVTVNATPDLSITQPPAVCSPNTIDLSTTVVGTGLGTNSYYTNANGTGSVTDETSVGDGTYYVVTVDGNNCSDTAQIDVTVNATPDLSITQPPAVCSPNTIDLTAIVGGTGLGTNSYYTNANGTGSVTDETSVGDGTYYVVAVDGNNCSDTAQIDVIVNSTPTISGVAENSPSGCGLNDGSIIFLRFILNYGLFSFLQLNG